MKGRERQQRTALSRHAQPSLQLPLSGYQLATRTLKFTLSRVDPMQRKTLYHSLPGCATILVHLCILFHSKAQWTDSSHSEICWDYADCFGEAIEFKRVPPLIKQLWDQSQLFFCLPLGRQTFQITCTPNDFQVSFFQITIFHAWG